MKNPSSITPFRPFNPATLRTDNKVKDNKVKTEQKPVGVEQKAPVEQKESFTPTAPVADKTPATTVKEEPAQPKPLKKPRGGEMAEMIENMNSPTGVTRAGVGPNGTIVMMDDQSFATPVKQESGTSPGESVLQQIAASLPEKEAEASKGGHNKKRANQMKAGTVTHSGPLEAIEVAGVKAYKAAKAAKEIAMEKVGAVAGEVTPEIVTDGAQALQGAVVQETGVGAATKLVGEAGKHAGKLSQGMETALKVAGGASMVLAPIMIGLGLKEGVEGVKERNTDKMLEGAAATTVGVRSGVAGAVMGKMAGVVEMGATATSVAKTALPVLGAAHGVLDIAIGTRQVIKGKTTKGLLNIGFGTAVTATAVLGLGLPGVAVASGFLVAKIGHGIASGRKAKKAEKAAAAEAQAQTKTPEPPTKET